MDKYGTCTVEDAHEIRATLKVDRSVVFAYSDNQIDCYVICLSLSHKIGIMPFGGNPDGRIYMGVYGIGCNHFSQRDIHPSYFEEKLKIDTEGAEAIAKLWKAMWATE